MNLRILTVGFSFCLALNMLFVEASEPIHGIVIDDQGLPLEYANVMLMAQADSTVIDGTVSDSCGRFALRGPGYMAILRVSALGFEDKFINNPSGNLGSICLTQSAVTLSEVVVKGKRQIVKMGREGVKVAIKNTYLEHVGTASDVLAKMPFVVKSGTELEVIGKGEPLIYINGRKLRDKSEIDRLSSDGIEVVEVITNPGAEYPSTVNAVIKIKTVPRAGEGFSMNDRTTIGYKHYAYLFEQVNFNYREEGFDLFGMLNYENYRDRVFINNNTRQYLQTGTVSQTSSSRDHSRYPVYQGRIGANYNKGSHSAGLYYDFTFRQSDGNASSKEFRYLNGEFYDELDELRSSGQNKRQHLLSTYYAGDFGKFKLTVNFDALWQNNDQHRDVEEISAINLARNFATDNDVDNRLLAGSANVAYSIFKGDIRLGTEISNIHRRDLYDSHADFIEDNDVKIDETTYALFVDSRQTFGKISLSVGLRWEYTNSDYFLFGVRQAGQSRNYDNFSPSASIMLPIGNVDANVKYSRKTSRPAFEQLSSSIKYIDRYNYERGNPNLQPVYRDYVSVSAYWKDLAVELDYSSTKNYFMWQTVEHPENPDVAMLTMQNMPRYGSWTVMLNYSPSVGCWNPTLMAGVMWQDFKLEHNGSILKMDNPMGIFRLNNAIHLPWDLWLNVDLSSRTSGDSENIHLKSSWNCDIGIYKSFADDTWSLKLQLNDVFDTWRQEFVSYNAISAVSANKIYDTRDLTLTIRYNFNSARSHYKGSGAANSEKGRL